jgi:hypothetical protein
MGAAPLERHHTERPGQATPLLGDSFSALPAVRNRVASISFCKIGDRALGYRGVIGIRHE